MTLVVDASIACKWFFDEPGADLARTTLLSGELLLAPELIVAELANAAWKRVLRAEISIEQPRSRYPASSCSTSACRCWRSLAALSPSASVFATRPTTAFTWRSPNSARSAC